MQKRKTVFTEHFEKKPLIKRTDSLKYADYHIERFGQLPGYLQEDGS